MRRVIQGLSGGVRWARGLGLTGITIGFLSFCSDHSLAEETGPSKGVLGLVAQDSMGATAPVAQVQDKPPLVNPDQYNPERCKAYFAKLKPGLIDAYLKLADYQAAEQYTIQALCDARTADFKSRSEYIGSNDDNLTKDKKRTLPAAFVKAIVESNEFDTPGYDSISIYGAIIEGDLILSRININNAIHFNDITFKGGVDLSYSSTQHNLDISGSLPADAGLCLRGFQSTKSLFLTDIMQQSDGQSEKPSTIKCDENTINSIDLPGARITGELNISRVVVRNVNAIGAQIVGQVQIQDSRFFDRSVDLDFSGASAGEFIIRGANASAVLDARTAEECFEHLAILDGINILGYAQFIRSNFCGISMTGAHVGKNLDLLGLTLGFFDFTGSTADGDLQIAPSPPTPTGNSARLPKWLLHADEPPLAASSVFKKNQPNLVLSHSSVSLLRAALNNWPGLCLRDSDDSQGKDCQKQPVDYSVGSCETVAAAPAALPDVHGYLTMLSEWTLGYPGSIKEKYPTIVADFRFKSFGKPTFCAFDKPAQNRLDYISDDPTNINAAEVERWLASTQYSPAEYQLMYDLLTTNGQSSDARRIGYLGKLIETRHEYEKTIKNGAISSLPIFLLHLVARWSIGYGYCSYVAILWAGFFCLIGAYIFATVDPNLLLTSDGLVYNENQSGWRKYLFGNCHIKKYKDGNGADKIEQDYGVISPIGYSFDTLLPVIRLRELHYQIEVGGWRHIYFYFHRIFGWILGIFVLAAFSGLIR